MDYLDFLYHQWEKDVANNETNLTWDEYYYYMYHNEIYNHSDTN